MPRQSIGDAFVTLRPDGSSFAADTKRVLTTALGTGLGVLGANGIQKAMTGVKDAFRASTDEAREAVREMNLTNQVLHTTGGVANVTAAQVEKLAQSLARKVGVDDEVIQQAERTLLSFTALHNEVGKGNDVFNRATKAAADLSAFFGRDMQQSAIQVGRALQNPLTGLTALQRVGVTFTQSQRDQIQALAESNHLLDAQRMILDALEGKFGGAAAAAANPADKLHASVKELEETVGTALLPVIDKVDVGLGGVIDAFNALPGPVRTAGATIAAAGGAALVTAVAVSKLSTALEGTAFAAAATRLGALGLAAVPVVAPLVAVAGAVYEIGYAADNVSKRVGQTLDSVTSSIAATNGQVTASSRSAIAAYLQINEASQAFTESGKNVDQFIAAARGGDDAVRAFVESMGRGPTATKTLTEELLVLAHAIDAGDMQGQQLAGILGDVGDQAAAAATSVESLSDAFDNHLGKLLNQLGADQSVTSAEGSLADAITNTGNAAEGSSAKTKTWADALSEVFDAIVNVERAHLSSSRSLKTLNDQIASQTRGAYNQAHNIVALNGQQAASADDVHSSLLDVVSAREAEVEAEAQSGEIANTVQARHQALIDKLLDLRNQYPALAGDIDRYIDAAKKIPELPLADVAEKTAKKQTDLAGATLAVVDALGRQAKADDDPINGLNTMNTQLGNLMDKYRNFPAVVAILQQALGAALATEEQIIHDMLAGQSPESALSAIALLGSAGAVPGRAIGGPVYAGESYWVGEKGPELFTPSGAGSITANGALGAGGPMIGTLQIVTKDTPNRIGGAVTQALRDSAYLLGVG